ncbi:MAG: NINE protein [Oculatellaceae cyanobacterium Prado106]|jgi:TM2 domain-containing membrane protein YozV|nr:NINE protein [Oculatellaceae cyanobacterium Prado106]
MRNKLVAAILAFFAGWCGLHKFYLGENFAGILYLLFFWSGIPAFIAFFEGLGLLLMADEVFEAKFNNRQHIGGYSYTPPRSLETTKDKAAAIAELKNLYDMGAITAEEYEAKRRKLLDSI